MSKKQPARKPIEGERIAGKIPMEFVTHNSKRWTRASTARAIDSAIRRAVRDGWAAGRAAEYASRTTCIHAAFKAENAATRLERKYGVKM